MPSVSCSPLQQHPVLLLRMPRCIVIFAPSSHSSSFSCSLLFVSPLAHVTNLFTCHTAIMAAERLALLVFTEDCGWVGVYHGNVYRGARENGCWACRTKFYFLPPTISLSLSLPPSISISCSENLPCTRHDMVKLKLPHAAYPGQQQVLGEIFPVEAWRKQ